MDKKLYKKFSKSSIIKTLSPLSDVTIIITDLCKSFIHLKLATNVSIPEASSKPAFFCQKVFED